MSVIGLFMGAPSAGTHRDAGMRAGKNRRNTSAAPQAFCGLFPGRGTRGALETSALAGRLGRSPHAEPESHRMSEDASARMLQDTLADRFGERIPVDPGLTGLAELAAMAGHRSFRRFRPQPLSRDALRLLCACALSAPSKSDLQQGDIVIVEDKAVRKRIAAAITDMPWIADAPAFLVFVANGARVPAIAGMRGKPFPNDHLDLFFNAVADAAIVLATFIRAAEAAGLGCCPISAIRDHAALVSELLALPDKVVPVAGLCVGWPAEQRDITPRLGLDATVHHGRFDQSDLAAQDRRLRSPPARPTGRLRANAIRSASARRRCMAGRRKRRGNMPSRCGPTSARSCAPRAFKPGLAPSRYANRARARSRAFVASTSRSRGGLAVSSERAAGGRRRPPRRPRG